LFQKIRLLLKTGQVVKGCISSESVIVNDIKSQMFRDDRLRQLSMALGVNDITLQELELQIKNHISRFPSEVSTLNAKSQSIESVPSQSFYAGTAPQPNRRTQMAFFGAQSDRFKNSDTRQRSFGRGKQHYHQPFARPRKDIPKEQWVSLSDSQQNRWRSLQRQIRELRKEANEFRRNPSKAPSNSAKFDDAEQADFAAESEDPGAFGFGSNAFFAGQDAAVSIADATSQLEESSHLDSQVAFVVSRLEDQEDFVFIPVDGGASSHVWKNPSMFISIKPYKTSINTAKEGEVLWSEGIGNVLLKTRNNAGEFVSLLLKDVLYVPTATCSLISVVALRADGRQTIYPEPDSGGVCRAGIYNCRKGLTKSEHAIALILLGNLSYVQIFPELQLSRSERSEICGSSSQSGLDMPPFLRFALWQRRVMVWRRSLWHRFLGIT
jgi:hypothetical protein